MKKPLLELLIALLTLFCGTTAGAAQPACDSLTDFTYGVRVTERAYAGFSDKTAGRGAEYAALKERLQAQIASGRDPYDALAEYLGWFDDSHLAAAGVEAYRPKSVRRENEDYRRRMQCYDPQFTHCRVDADTYLIRFPSCDLNQTQRAAVRAAVDAYLHSGCGNLIVDIRGNDGGMDSAYEPLLALLYDHQGSGDGIEFRASEQSIAYTRKYVGNTAQGQELIRRLEQAPAGSFITRGAKTYPIRRDSVYGLPRRAALIVDSQVASSGEQLTVDVMACSHRTTIYGRDNTMGCLDNSNCAVLSFRQDTTKSMQVPVTRSYRVAAGRGIDSEGIAPDVRITLPLPARLTDNVDEWVVWVASELKK